MVGVVWFRFQMFLDPLPCWLAKTPPKREFIDNHFVTYFGVFNFGNTSAMGVIFLLKMFKA